MRGDLGQPLPRRLPSGPWVPPLEDLGLPADLRQGEADADEGESWERAADRNPWVRPDDVVLSPERGGPVRGEVAHPNPGTAADSGRARAKFDRKHERWTTARRAIVVSADDE